MHEEDSGAVSVTANPEAPTSAAPPPSSAPAHSYTVLEGGFNGGGNVPSFSAPLPSSLPELALASGRMLEESRNEVSLAAFYHEEEEVFNGSSGNNTSSLLSPSSLPPPELGQILEESSRNEVSLAAAYHEEEEVFNGSGNNTSSVLAPSSLPPEPGQILEESSNAVSLTAYHEEEVFNGSRNNSYSVLAPSSAVPVPSPAPALSWILEEDNKRAISVTAHHEVFHASGNTMPSLALTPSSVVPVQAPPPAPGLLLEGYLNNGAGFVTSYAEVFHGSRKKTSPPPSAAPLAPTSGRTLDHYAKEWAARKAAAGAPLHHCVLPFLTGAPKEVECRVCYRIIHPLEEIKCSVSRCEQSFHLTCVVEDTVNFIAESFKCPQHGCMVCKQKMFFWRCGRCTVAAHTKCAPWPLIQLKNDHGSAICWRHPSNWLLQNENADLTKNIEEAFCRLPVPYVNEEFNIDSTIRNFSAIVCKPPSYTHIRRNVYLVKKKRADSSAETGCRNCRADSVCRDDCECRGLSMSCSKNCRCSDLCSNKPFRKDKKFKIVKSEGCGWGAVALEPLEKGDFIIEYVGEVINDATCEQRLWEMKRRGDKNFYMCEISKDCTIDATFKGNTSRFLNHSCDPNCKLEKWQVDGETRVGVFASRSIEVGEPLTYDYRFVHFGEKVKCNCGAKICQGYLGIQLKNPTQDALAAAALENQGDCSPSRLKPETHLLPWTNCIEVPFNLRSKTKIDRLCWGRKRQRTSIIDPSPSSASVQLSVIEAAASVPKGFSAELA